jgi:hypothetical protein
MKEITNFYDVYYAFSFTAFQSETVYLHNLLYVTLLVLRVLALFSKNFATQY